VLKYCCKNRFTRLSCYLQNAPDYFTITITITITIIIIDSGLGGHFLPLWVTNVPGLPTLENFCLSKTSHFIIIWNYEQESNIHLPFEFVGQKLVFSEVPPPDQRLTLLLNFAGSFAPRRILQAHVPCAHNACQVCFLYAAYDHQHHPCYH